MCIKLECFNIFTYTSVHNNLIIYYCYHVTAVTSLLSRHPGKRERGGGGCPNLLLYFADVWTEGP